MVFFEVNYFLVLVVSLRRIVHKGMVVDRKHYTVHFVNIAARVNLYLLPWQDVSNCFLTTIYVGVYLIYCDAQYALVTPQPSSSQLQRIFTETWFVLNTNIRNGFASLRNPIYEQSVLMITCWTFAYFSSFFLCAIQWRKQIRIRMLVFLVFETKDNHQFSSSDLLFAKLFI